MAQYSVDEGKLITSRYPQKNVCVIGGGVAGLVSAKVLKNNGFDVTVFEKEPGIGGVWAETRAYPGLRSNNPKEAYAFSDFDYPESTDDFPTAGQILRYLKSYSKHFNLGPHIQTETEVVSVGRNKGDNESRKQGFRVEIQQANQPEKRDILKFDHLVICNGVFSKPHIPQIEGRDKFEGEIIHSSQFTYKEMIRGKRVTVVGGGKSAMDCATVAGKYAASSTLIFRRPHWMIPRYFGNKRVDYILFNRFSEQIFPVYHNASKSRRLIQMAISPLIWFWRKTVDWIVVNQGNIPEKLIPEVPVISGLENNGIGTEFYEILHDGRADIHRSVIRSFASPNRIELDNGKQIETDVVIFATGWNQDVEFLEPELKQIIRKNGFFRLYRHILPPQERNMGFIGYASSGNAPLTSEISAHWLSQHFMGELNLPGVWEIEREIDKVRKWTQQVFPQRKEGYFIGAYVGHYIDQLMNDMELETQRAKNVFREYWGPFWAKRYREVESERKQTATE